MGGENIPQNLPKFSGITDDDDEDNIAIVLTGHTYAEKKTS